MLPCPFCGGGLARQGRENWFECPNCGNWVRRRLNRNGVLWLEAGVFVNGHIQAVQLAQSRAQAPNAVQATNLPNIDKMDLPAVQGARQQVVAGLRQIENIIQQILELQKQNRQNEQLFRQYGEQLLRLRQQRIYWEGFDHQLQEREVILQQEWSRGRRVGVRRAVIFIVVGAIVFAFGIYFFTQELGRQLDLREMLVAVVFGAASALITWSITWLIAQFD